MISSFKNQLLLSLSSEDIQLLSPHLTMTPMGLRKRLEDPDKPILNVYFMQEGIASVVSIGKGDRVEVGLIGPEGMSGAMLLLGHDRCLGAVDLRLARHRR